MDLLGYLDRLEEQFEAREGEVRAFVSEPGRFDRLRRQARELIDRFPDPDARPPLFGVPIGCKDIIHANGFASGCGSRLPPEDLTGPQAAAVTALLEAGALILGKTESTEFAFFAPAPTRNPHHLGHTPGGSSSGSAAAVAAGLCPLTLGTQTIGSITRPAAFCGVTGFKASYDRVPRDGVVPLSPSLDHVGTFTADVAGARLAASVLIADFGTGSRVLDRRPILGIPEGPYLDHATEVAAKHFDEVCSGLAAAGYEIRRVPAFSDFAEIRERHMLIVAAEAAHVHRPWFDRYRDLYHSKTRELIERGRSIRSGTLQEALSGREDLRRQLTEAMDEHELDLWIAPSAPGPAPAGLDFTGDPVMNLPWTHSGLPTLGFPSGADADGMPLGLQVVGRWRHDEALLAWGERLQGDLE